MKSLVKVLMLIKKNLFKISNNDSLFNNNHNLVNNYNKSHFYQIYNKENILMMINKNFIKINNLINNCNKNHAHYNKDKLKNNYRMLSFDEFKEIRKFDYDFSKINCLFIFNFKYKNLTNNFY